MKKKLFALLLALMIIMPVSAFAKEKVKVYMFEAGGCPYGEKEMEC